MALAAKERAVLLALCWLAAALQRGDGAHASSSSSPSSSSSRPSEQETHTKPAWKDGDLNLGGLFPIHFGVLSRADSLTVRPEAVECVRNVCYGGSESGRVHDNPIFMLPIFLMHSIKTNSYEQLSDKLRFNFRGLRWMLAMAFAVDEINADNLLLPGLRLGYKMADTCNTVSKALEATLGFVARNKLGALGMGGVCNCTPAPRANTVSVVGATSSGVSTAVANLLSLFRIPQVSYASSSRVLSNKQQYRSFMRTILSDEQQATALAELVREFGWTWVGLIASDDDYGRPGIERFREETLEDEDDWPGRRRGYGNDDDNEEEVICVEFSETVSLYDPPERIHELADMIANATARVIVVFASGTDLDPLMREVARRNLTGRTWIGSEGWVSSSLIARPEIFHVVGSTLGFVQRPGHIPGFREYLQKVHPQRHPNNVFVRQLWEATFNCTLKAEPASRDNCTQSGIPVRHGASEDDGSSEKCPEGVKGAANAPRPFCTGRENISAVKTPFLDYTDLRITYNVYLAVYAIAHALHDMLFGCREGAGLFEGGKCTNIQQLEPWQLLRYLQVVRFRNNKGEEVQFDEKGDPRGGYSLVNWQQSPKDGSVQLVEVGSYDGRKPSGQRLVVDKSRILWHNHKNAIPTSVCTQPCSPGTRKGILEGEQVCCFECISCAEGEYNNESDANSCLGCPEDSWPSANHTMCVPKREEYLSWREPFGVCLASVGCLGAVLTLSVAAVFVKHRGTAIVKATNVELSYLLFFSLFCCFMSSLFFIGKPSTVACKLRQPTFGISFVLCVSCVLVKTHRVLQVFESQIPGRGGVRKLLGLDHQLLLVFLFTLVQVIICAVWLYTAPPTFEEDDTFKNDVIYLSCDEGSQLALGFVIGYTCLLAGICFLFAFRARKLPENFNEAKFITFSMLVFFIVWLSFIPAYVSSQGKFVAAVEVIAILVSSFGLLSCIFFHKCYIILLKPERNTPEEVRCSTAAHSFKTAARVNLHTASSIGSGGSAGSMNAKYDHHHHHHHHHHGRAHAASTLTVLSMGVEKSLKNSQETEADAEPLALASKGPRHANNCQDGGEVNVRIPGKELASSMSSSMLT